MKFIKRVEQLVDKLGEGIHEREEVIAVALLGALSGQNTFLYGPPGTAKSLISRRISSAFKDAPYFECLMNRFTTPEEVFGPVSLSALKEDKYLRKTSGYLPTAGIGFLDEIWKSSPAILNTLLTLTNERIFRNGDRTEKSPLKALFAASNETPLDGQGLDALYDRFTLRMLVPPMQQRENFENLLNSEPVATEPEIPDHLKIDTDTWDQIVRGLHKIELSRETLTVIALIRQSLSELEEPVYVSDRRWQKAAIVMKASAFLCERKQTNHSDTLLLRHCLWTKEDNREDVISIVENAVRDCGCNTKTNIAELDHRKENLDQEIQNELFHVNDVYKTVTLNGSSENYFHVKRSIDDYYSNTKLDFYISIEKMKTREKFHPVNTTGIEFPKITCSFDSQGSCSIEHDQCRRNSIDNYVPVVQFHKGDRKEDINERLISALDVEARDVKKAYRRALEFVLEKKSLYQRAMATPFVPESVQEIAIEGILKQIDGLKLRIADCERLTALCASCDQKQTKQFAKVV